MGCVLFFGILVIMLFIYKLVDSLMWLILNKHSTEATIIEVMHQLPFGSLIIVLFLISAFLFLATTFDSGSYILAAAFRRR